MRMHATRLQARLVGEAAEDEERSGPRQATALGVEKELGPVAAVEKRPSPTEVTAQGVGCFSPQRDDALLAALADRAHEPVVQIDATSLESHCLAHSQPGPVEQLDERAIAKVARR